MLRKLLRQNAQLCFPVNTLLPLPQVSGILVAIFRNCIDKELYYAFYVNTLLRNKNTKVSFYSGSNVEKLLRQSAQLCFPVNASISQVKLYSGSNV